MADVLPESQWGVGPSNIQYVEHKRERNTNMNGRAGEVVKSSSDLTTSPALPLNHYLIVKWLSAGESIEGRFDM